MHDLLSSMQVVVIARIYQAGSFGLLCVIAWLAPGLWAQKAPQQGLCSIQGRVLDRSSGEGIAKALVSVRNQSLETVTDNTGHFTLDKVASGEVELYVSTVDYELLRKRLTLSTGDRLEVTLSLGRRFAPRRDEVIVTSGPFEPLQTGVVSEHVLSQTEMNSLSSVLVEDPIRSVQTLPGVATSDDSNAEFSLRGMGFSTIGVYVDGVLLSSPFHTIDDLYQTASLTLFNSNSIGSIELLSGGFPARYGEREGAALDIRTRDGNSEKMLTELTAGMTGVSGSSEGPLGRSGKATWLVSARKSYLGYLLKKTNWNDLVIGHQDVEAKLAYQPNSHQQFVLNSLLGSSWFEPGSITAENNYIKKAGKSTELVPGTWNWSLSPTTLVSTQAAYAHNDGQHHDQSGAMPFTMETHEYTVQQGLQAGIGKSHTWQTGWSGRRMLESLYSRYSDVLYSDFTVRTRYDRGADYLDAFTQDSFRICTRLAVTMGVRFEWFSPTEQHLLMPRASLTWRLSSRNKLAFSWGEYGQFPAARQLWGEVNNPALRAERTRQYVATFEHRLNDKLRFHVELYDTEIREGIYSAAEDWRLPRDFDIAHGLVPVCGALLPRIGHYQRNYLAGYARGVEVQIQRRSANRLSGWISYAYGHARDRDDPENLSFDSDYDQRNTVNVFGSYRLSKTINLSSKYRYGSNFPVAGFYRKLPSGAYDLAPERNLERLDDYSRLDLRTDKATYLRSRKMTLYAEILNAANRKNRGCRKVTLLEASPACQDGFPILPSVGFRVDF